jgi:nuclear pore complex protein Nup54
VFGHLSKQEPPKGLLSNLSTQPGVKQQLDQLSVENVYPLLGFSDEQIKSYLETPPTGVNSLLWDTAKKNNPNTKKLIPVQINGFQEINKRFNLQDKENEGQKATLNQLSETIETINSKNKLIKSKIDQFKARNEDLEHRVLKV